MIQKTTFVFLLFSLIAGCALFYTSEKVDKAKRQYYSTKNELAKEREAIRVLKAEWSYLTTPERIEKLAHQYLLPQEGEMAPSPAPKQFLTPPDLHDFKEKSADAQKWEEKARILTNTAALHHKIAPPATTPTRHIRPTTAVSHQTKPLQIKVKETYPVGAIQTEILPPKPDVALRIEKQTPKKPEKTSDDFQAVLRNLELP